MTSLRRRAIGYATQPVCFLRLRMSFSENRLPLFRDMRLAFTHVLFGKPAATFPGHAPCVCACPFRKTGCHFSGTCALRLRMSFSENRLPLFRNMRLAFAHVLFGKPA